MAFTGIRGDESASRSEYEGVSYGEKVKGQYIQYWNGILLSCFYIFIVGI